MKEIARCPVCGGKLELIRKSINGNVYRCLSCGNEVIDEENEANDYHIYREERIIIENDIERIADSLKNEEVCQCCQSRKLERQIDLNNGFTYICKKCGYTFKNEVVKDYLDKLYALGKKYPIESTNDPIYHLIFIILFSNNFTDYNDKVKQLMIRLDGISPSKEDSIIYKKYDNQLKKLIEIENIKKIQEMQKKSDSKTKREKNKKKIKITIIILLIVSVISFFTYFLIKPETIIGYSKLSCYDGEVLNGEYEIQLLRTYNVDIPSKIGSTFSGYYDENENKVIDENGKSVGVCNWFPSYEKKVYAKWTTNQYYISFIGENVDLENTKIAYYYGETITLPRLKNVLGLSFYGWKIENVEYSVEANFTYTIPSYDVVATAIWKENYIHIKTKEDLENISKNDSSASYFILDNDIDLEGEIWNPISIFLGYFDGDGHKIKNLKINFNLQIEAINVGFIGINYGTIDNIIFENCDVLVASDWSNYNREIYAGVIAGKNEKSGLIKECSLSNVNFRVDSTDVGLLYEEKYGYDPREIDTSCPYWVQWFTQEYDHIVYQDNNWNALVYKMYVGGICGYNSGIINRCNFDGKVESNLFHMSVDINFENIQYTGGIIGINYGTISNSFFKGEVKNYLELDNTGNGNGWVGSIYPNAKSYQCGLIGLNKGTQESNKIGNYKLEEIKSRLYAPQYAFLSGANYYSSSKAFYDNVELKVDLYFI